MIEKIKVFLIQSWYSYRSLFRDAEFKSYIILKIGQPMFQLIFFVLLAKYCMQTNDLTVRIIGNAFMLCQKNCIHGLGRTFVSERMSGTLKIVVVTPYKKYLAFFEKSFFHIWDALISVTMGILVGWLIFGLDLGDMDIKALILVAIIAIFSCAGIGMVLGSLGLMSENMVIYNNLIVMFMLTFSGATFPVIWLPKILTKITYIVPTSRSIIAVEKMINGADFLNVIPLVGGEILLGVFYMLLGYVLLQYAERTALRNASIDLY